LEAAVLDAGDETYSPRLAWLHWYGYRDLHGINLVFAGDFTRDPVRYVVGDMTRAGEAEAGVVPDNQRRGAEHVVRGSCATTPS
jgi:hypothetical protein